VAELVDDCAPLLFRVVWLIFVFARPHPHARILIARETDQCIPGRC
jgi:hypothetical protein